MEPKTEGQIAAEEYAVSLADLDSVSKVEINALTMAAEDNKDYAVHVAACIEDRLKSAPSNQKLPILYLIDSICKNNPKSLYVELFTQNIVSNFCNVFEVSPEKTRRCLYKLRLTWDKTKTFPPKKLNAIDERVHEMDPNWPVLHKIAATQPQVKPLHKPSLKTNQPQSLQQNQQKQQTQAPQQQSQQTQQITQQSGTTTTNKTNGARNKQPRTRAAKRMRNNNNSIQINNNNPTNVISGQIQTPPAITLDGLPPQNLQTQAPLLITGQQPTPTMPMYPSHIQQPMLLQQQTNTPPAALPTQQQPFDGMYQLQTQYQPQTIYPQQPLQSVPINPPLQAMDQGPLVNPSSYPPLATHNFPQHSQQSTVDNLQNQNSYLLSNELESTLNSLYGGKQCSNCSLRFDNVNNKYGIHLDWHFRQNLKSDNMFARRKWYYPLNLWVQFREINDDEIQESNNSDSNNVNDLLISNNDHEVPTAPASKEDEKNICSVCHETFEKFWAEEEEEWRLRNARMHDDQRVYHPLCLMDMLQATASE